MYYRKALEFQAFLDMAKDESTLVILVIAFQWPDLSFIQPVPLWAFIASYCVPTSHICFPCHICFPSHLMESYTKAELTSEDQCWKVFVGTMPSCS